MIIIEQKSKPKIPNGIEGKLFEFGPITVRILREYMIGKNEFIYRMDWHNESEQKALKEKSNE